MVGEIVSLGLGSPLDPVIDTSLVVGKLVIVSAIVVDKMVLGADTVVN
jgi:hypothetical protein